MQYNNNNYKWKPKIITDISGIGEIPGISAIQPTPEINPIYKPRTWQELREAYNYTKQDPYTKKLLANYNDPEELNSYLDALVNRKAVSKEFGDTWGTISTISGTVAVVSFIAAAALAAAAFFTGGATAPGAAAAAKGGMAAAGAATAGTAAAKAAALTTAAGIATKVGAVASIPAIPAATKVTYDYTIKPIAEGRADYALINNLQNIAETADFAANPIKGLVLDGPQGFLKATGLTDEGRVNYDYDTGFVVTDMLLEFISDPMTWFEGPANIAKAVKVGKAAQEVAEGLIKNIDDIIPTVGKTIVDTAKKNKAFKKLKSFLKEMSNEITEAYAKGSIDKRNPVLGFVEDLTTVDLKERKLTRAQIKTLTERVRKKTQEALEKYVEAIVRDCTDEDVINILKKCGKTYIDPITQSRTLWQDLTLDQLSTHTIRALNNITEITDTVQKFMMRNALMTPIAGAGLDVLKYFDYPMFKWANSNLIQRLIKAELFKPGVGFNNLAKYTTTKKTWKKGFKYFITAVNPDLPITADPLDSFYTLVNNQFMRDKSLIQEQLIKHINKPIEQAAALDAVVQELYNIDFNAYVQMLDQINVSEGGIYKDYVDYLYTTIKKRLYVDASNAALARPRHLRTGYAASSIEHVMHHQQHTIDTLTTIAKVDLAKNPEKCLDMLFSLKQSDIKLNTAFLYDKDYYNFLISFVDGGRLNKIFNSFTELLGLSDTHFQAFVKNQKHFFNNLSDYTFRHKAVYKEIYEQAQAAADRDVRNMRKLFKASLDKLQKSAQNYLYLKDLQDNLDKVILPEIKGIDDASLRHYILYYLLNTDVSVTEALTNYDYTLAKVYYNINKLLEDKQFKINAHSDICEQISIVYKNYLKSLQDANIDKVNANTVQSFVEQANNCIRQIEDNFKAEVIPTEITQARVMLYEIEDFIKLSKNVENMTGLSDIKFALTNEGTIFNKAFERKLIDADLIIEAQIQEQCLNLFNLDQLKEIPSVYKQQTLKLGQQIVSTVEHWTKFNLDIEPIYRNLIGRVFEQLQLFVVKSDEATYKRFKTFKVTTNWRIQLAYIIEVRKAASIDQTTYSIFQSYYNKTLKKLKNVTPTDLDKLKRIIGRPSDYYNLDVYNTMRSVTATADIALNDELIRVVGNYDVLNTAPRQHLQSFEDMRKLYANANADDPKTVQLERYANLSKKYVDFFDWFTELYNTKKDTKLIEERLEEYTFYINRIAGANTQPDKVKIAQHRITLEKLKQFWEGTLRFNNDTDPEWLRFVQQLQLLQDDINEYIDAYNTGLYRHLMGWNTEGTTDISKNYATANVDTLEHDVLNTPDFKARLSNMAEAERKQQFGVLDQDDTFRIPGNYTYKASTYTTPDGKYTFTYTQPVSKFNSDYYEEHKIQWSDELKLKWLSESESNPEFKTISDEQVRANYIATKGERPTWKLDPKLLTEHVNKELSAKYAKEFDDYIVSVDGIRALFATGCIDRDQMAILADYAQSIIADPTLKSTVDIQDVIISFIQAKHNTTYKDAKKTYSIFKKDYVKLQLEKAAKDSAQTIDNKNLNLIIKDPVNAAKQYYQNADAKDIAETLGIKYIDFDEYYSGKSGLDNALKDGLIDRQLYDYLKTQDDATLVPRQYLMETVDQRKLNQITTEQLAEMLGISPHIVKIRYLDEHRGLYDMYMDDIIDYETYVRVSNILRNQDVHIDYTSHGYDAYNITKYEAYKQAFIEKQGIPTWHTRRTHDTPYNVVPFSRDEYHQRLDKAGVTAKLDKHFNDAMDDRTRAARIAYERNKISFDKKHRGILLQKLEDSGIVLSTAQFNKIINYAFESYKEFDDVEALKKCIVKIKQDVLFEHIHNTLGFDINTYLENTLSYYAPGLSETANKDAYTQLKNYLEWLYKHPDGGIEMEDTIIDEWSRKYTVSNRKLSEMIRKARREHAKAGDILATHPFKTSTTPEHVIIRTYLDEIFEHNRQLSIAVSQAYDAAKDWYTHDPVIQATRRAMQNKVYQDYIYYLNQLNRDAWRAIDTQNKIHNKKLYELYIYQKFGDPKSNPLAEALLSAWDNQNSPVALEWDAGLRTALEEAHMHNDAKLNAFYEKEVVERNLALKQELFERARELNIATYKGLDEQELVYLKARGITEVEVTEPSTGARVTKQLYKGFGGYKKDRVHVNLSEPIKEMQNIDRTLRKATNDDSIYAMHQLFSLTPEAFEKEFAHRLGILVISDIDITSDPVLQDTFLRFIERIKKSQTIQYVYDTLTETHHLMYKPNVKLNKQGRTVYVNGQQILRDRLPRTFDRYNTVDALLNSKEHSFTKMLTDLDKDVEELTGSSLGTSQGEILDQDSFKAFFALDENGKPKNMSDEVWLAYGGKISKSGVYTIDLEQRFPRQMFNTLTFNESFLGTIRSKNSLNKTVYSSNILRNSANVLNRVQYYTKAKTEYVYSVFDSVFSISGKNSLYANYSDADILAALQINPDYKLIALVHDKKYGVKVREIMPLTVKDIQKAKQLNAVILPAQVFKDMYSTVNHRIGSEGFMKIWNRLMYIMKFGYLCNPGTWLRNIADTNIKTQIELGDEAGTYKKQARQLIREYDRINDFIAKRSKEGVIKTEALLEWFKAHPDGVLNYQTYREITDSWFSQSVSGGMIKEFIPDDTWGTLTHYTSKVMDWASGDTERVNRLAIYLADTAKGADTTKALHHVAKVHFDYAYKSGVEQLLEAVFPFSTYTLRNLSYWAEALDKHPWLMRVYVDVMKPNWDFQNYTPEELAANVYVRNQILNGQFKITDDFMGKVIALKLNPSIQDAIKFVSNPVNSMYEKLAAPLAVPLNKALGEYTQPTSAIPVFGPLIQRGTQMIKQGNPAPSVLSVYNTPRKSGQKTANGKWSNANLAGVNDYRDKQYRVPRYRNNNTLDPYYTFGKQRYSTLMYPIIDVAHDVKMKYSINVYNKIKNQVKVDVQKDIRNRMRIDANRFRK